MKILDLVSKILRKFFRNTFIHRLPITELIYQFLMRIRTSKFNEDFPVQFRGKLFYCQPGDISLLPTLIDGSFEKTELDLFSRILEQSEGRYLFVDVGANIGVYSVIASEFALSGTEIFAFEPDPRNSQRLEMNVLLNDAKNIFIEKVAVGEDSLVHINLDKYGGLTRLSRSRSSDTIEVQSVSLDNYFSYVEPRKDFITVLKIDVEGFEPNVIRNSWKFIKKVRPIIFVEYQSINARNHLDHWGKTLEDLIDSYDFVYRVCNSKIHLLTPLNRNKVLTSLKLQTLIFSPTSIL